jgi:CysZ protein
VFLTDLVRGFQLSCQGVTFLARHRSLWKWACLPLLVNIVVFTTAMIVFLAFMYAPLYNLATSFLYSSPPETWYAWLWVAPLRLLAWGIGLLLLVSALVAVYTIFLLLGTAIASPFLAVLAQRVEVISTGRDVQDSTTLREALYAFGVSIVGELRKLGFFLSIQLLIVLLGLIPPLAPVMVLVGTLFTILFLPLEYISFAMDQRQLRFAQRRTLIWQHRWLMLGFGAAAFLTLLVPFLNFLCLPALVVGGTLLFLRIEAPPSRPL